MVSFDDKVRAAKEACFSTTEKLDYFVASFVDKSNVDIIGDGIGGMAEVKEMLASQCDDKVAFGGFAVTAIDERGSVISVRRKVVSFIYTGPSCGPMARAKAATTTGEWNDVMEGCAVVLKLSDPADLNENDVESRLRAAGGAHQPKVLDFTNSPVEAIE